MDGIMGIIGDPFYGAMIVGLVSGHVAWLLSKPKPPQKDASTAAIIASMRNPLIGIVGLLGAILYTLQVPHL